MAKEYVDLGFTDDFMFCKVLTDTKRESLQCLAPVRMKASSRLELY